VINEWVVPRWGIGSVRTHLDIDDLVFALLLFDRLIIPTPENLDEYDRWSRMGWQPDLLAPRVTQLGELVELVPWDEALRTDWQTRWDKLREMGQSVEYLAYGATAATIATQAWDDIVRRAAEENRAPIPPVPMSWYPAPVEARGDILLNEQVPNNSQIQGEVSLLFRRELAQPVATDPEEALEVAFKLATQAEFVAARQTMFAWELLVAGQQISIPDAIRGLKDAADCYDQLVRESARVIPRVVDVVVPAAASHGTNIWLPGAGPAAGWVARKVTARLVPVVPPPNPYQEPGAALSIARRAMSAVLFESAA
jgi:hypothetical protein